MFSHWKKQNISTCKEYFCTKEKSKTSILDTTDHELYDKRLPNLLRSKFVTVSRLKVEMYLAATADKKAKWPFHENKN